MTHPFFQHEPETIGEAVFTCTQNDETAFDEMGEDLIATYEACKTDAEREIMNRTLIAICSYGFDGLNQEI